MNFKNLIYMIDDSIKKDRPDINTLFLKYISRSGICIKIIDIPIDYKDKNIITKQIIMLKNSLSLIKIINENRNEPVDTIVQVRNLLLYGLLALIIAKINQQKFCYWMSFPVVDASKVWISRNYKGFKNIQWLKKNIKYLFSDLILYRIVLKYSDYIFVQSDIMKKRIIERGCDSNKITAVPMGVDTDLVKYIKNDFSLIRKNPSKMKKVLYIGALDDARDIYTLLRSFKKVKRKINNATLVLIGGAQNEKDVELLKVKSKELNIENDVDFLGNLDRNDVFKHILNADIGISSIPPIDIYECSSPTKIIEYLSLGLPTVANDIADQKDLIRLSKGGICTEYSENQFSDAILTILQDKVNFKYFKQYGSKIILKQRSYETISKKVIKVYMNI